MDCAHATLTAAKGNVTKRAFVQGILQCVSVLLCRGNGALCVHSAVRTQQVVLGEAAV